MTLATLPRPVCAPGDIGIEITDDAPDALRATLTEYFAQFLRPERMPRSNRVMCVCGEPLTGMLIGTFRWGLAHGEGCCGACGWPARAYHRPIDADGEILSLSAVLLYAPRGCDGVEVGDDE